MILERVPHSGNLIESDIAKCKQSIAIKRGKAVECLRLETLKPVRIMDLDMPKHSKQGNPGSPKKAHTTKNEVNTKIFHRVGLNKLSRKLPSRDCEKGLQKSKVRWPVPPLLPEPPWPPPPDERMIIAAQRTRILPGMEERKLEQESLTSQWTSTSKVQVQATYPSMPDSENETMLFAAAGHRMLIDLTEKRKLEEKSPTSQSTSARKIQAKHFSIPDSDLKGFEWEPPKQAEDVDLGKTIADCEWSV